MLQVTIPCHPMSRAILLSEYGAEPLVLDTHDILFEIVSTRITPDDLRKKQELTHFITFAVNARLAAHLARYGGVAGLRLFKFHKHLLCRYADAQVRVRGKGHARPAIQEFLNLYSVDEDAYGLETAYKLYQRFGWEIAKKSPQFVERMRRKPGAVLSEKMIVRKGPAADADLIAELAVVRFMSSVQARMKRYHRRLEKQARAYIYVERCGHTIRSAADVLGMPPSTVHHSCAAMRARITRNRTFAGLLAEALALPAET